MWDNNDFGEETLSGKGTTHNTNGIIVQRSSNGNLELFSDKSVPIKKSRKCLSLPREEIPPFHASIKQGPNLSADACDAVLDLLFSNPCEVSQFEEHLVMVLTKMNPLQTHTLPGWTGFHIMLDQTKEEHIKKSKIGYLPVVSGSPTELSTVNEVLRKSLSIAEELEIDCIVLVFDLAFYLKVQRIRWAEQQLIDKTVVRLGEFHTILSILSVLGKRFGDAGLADILVESDVIAPGSIQGVMKGRQYNRAMRVVKLFSEALRRLQIEAFLDSSDCDEATKENFLTLCKKFYDSFPSSDFNAKTQSDEVYLAFLEKFTNFIADKCKELPTFNFWNSFLHLSDLILTFVQATRRGNFESHLSSASKLIPWFFAYDHTNYARYMPVYVAEMVSVNMTNPDVSRSFFDGDFACQQQEKYPFSMTPMDQVIEQTINRDSKTKGGQTGFSNDPGAANRWVLSHAKRAQITQACKSMSGVIVEYGKSKLLGKRRDVDEKDTVSIQETIQNRLNPFTYDVPELINIVTGQVCSDEVAEHSKNAYSIGCEEAKKFITERLKEKKIDFYAQIKKQNLKNFSSSSKGPSVSQKETNRMKQDQNLITRLLLVARERKLDRDMLLSSNLSPFPPSISTADGELVHNSKSKMLHHLASKYPSAIQSSSPTEAVLILDGMAVIQQLAGRVPKTFGELAIIIFTHVMTQAIFYNASRVDFV